MGYRLAEGLSPAYEPLCGRLHEGKLYGVESVRGFTAQGWPARPWPSGYLLTWDIETGRVLERHLLPDLPESLTAGEEGLRIVIHGGDELHLADSRLVPEVSTARHLGSREQAVFAGMLPALNLLLASSSDRWTAWHWFDDRLPADTSELETLLRSERERDPTQPWYRLLLAQTLWQQSRHGEAEEEWEGLTSTLASMPYYELAWMSALLEASGRGEHAEGLHRLALAARHRLGRPPSHCNWLERRVTTAAGWWGLEGKIPTERRHRFWRRMVELGGIAPGDTFRSALWLDHLLSTGKLEAAREERGTLARARRHPHDRALGAVWVDYALYGALAALLTALGLRWRRRRQAGTTGNPRRLRGAPARPLRHPLGLALLVFATIPLVWVLASVLWLDLPAPGPISASFFPGARLELSWLPPSPEPSTKGADGSTGPTPWSGQRSLRLLRVYPAAEPLALVILGISTAMVLAGFRHRFRPLRRRLTRTRAPEGDPPRRHDGRGAGWPRWRR